MAFVQFMGWRWPNDATEILSTSILDVQSFKSRMVKDSDQRRRRSTDASLLYRRFTSFWRERLGGNAPANHRPKSGARSIYFTRSLGLGG